MSVYLDMAHDAGERGEDAEQLAQAIEADHRATLEGESMNDKLTDPKLQNEKLGILKRTITGAVDSAPDAESWVVRFSAVDVSYILEGLSEVAALEQRVSEPKLSDAWQCQSCGCHFPHIPQVLDNDVKRCSKCVQVEVLEQQAEKWELEAKRLYGVGQDIEEMRVALEQRVEGLEEKNRVAIKIIQLARSVAVIPIWVGKLEAHLAAEEETPKPCEAIIFHGPGHQSRTKCEKTGPHKIHSARYGSMEQRAEWVEDETHSGAFDEPPALAEEED